MDAWFWCWELPLLAAAAFVIAGAISDGVDLLVGRPRRRKGVRACR